MRLVQLMRAANSETFYCTPFKKITKKSISEKRCMNFQRETANHQQVEEISSHFWINKSVLISHTVLSLYYSLCIHYRLLSDDHVSVFTYFFLNQKSLSALYYICITVAFFTRSFLDLLQLFTGFDMNFFFAPMS